MDAVVLTAVDVEAEAVLEHLNPEGEWQPYRKAREVDGSWWYQTVLEVSSEISVRLVTGTAYSKGMPAAAVHVAKAVSICRPRWVLMPGITAGHPEKTKLGDIVVPLQVSDYGAGKWRGDRFHPATRPQPLDDRIKSACDAMKFSRTEDLRTIAMSFRGERPAGTPDLAVHIAPAVSGAAVVDSLKEWDRILAQDKDVVALDMEAYAVVLAARMLPPRPKVLVAKAVSDFAVEKDDTAQEFAAYTSVKFLRMFIEDVIAPQLPEVETAVRAAG